MNTAEIQAVMTATQAGDLTFPETVGRLLAVGIESYFVDFASGRETLYATDGSTHTEELRLPHHAIAAELSAADIRAAIRGAQTDTIRYPEFVKRATASGVIAYWAFLTGKRVIYFGRQGDIHIEEFPRAEP